MTTKNNYADRRERVLILIKLGYATQSEAAQLAGVSRQRVAIWVRKAPYPIHPKLARERHLRDLMHAASA